MAVDRPVDTAVDNFVDYWAVRLQSNSPVLVLMASSGSVDLLVPGLRLIPFHVKQSHLHERDLLHA